MFATSYLASLFEEEFKDFSQDLEISYAVESVPLGTGGAIRNAGRMLRGSADAPVLILNGDILSGLDLRDVLEQHAAREADVTLHLTRVADPRAFGLVPTDDAGRVLSFLEKPKTPEECVTDQINAGCYVFRRSVLDAIPADREVSVEQETFPELVAQGRRVFGHTTQDYWRDLGTPLAFVHGSADLVTGKVTSPLVERSTEALIHPTATVDPTARITGGSTIGPHTVIGPRVVVDRSILGGSVTVAEGPGSTSPWWTTTPRSAANPSSVRPWWAAMRRSARERIARPATAVVRHPHSCPRGTRQRYGCRMPDGPLKSPTCRTA